MYQIITYQHYHGDIFLLVPFYFFQSQKSNKENNKCLSQGKEKEVKLNNIFSSLVLIKNSF